VNAQIDPFQSWNPSLFSDFKMDVALRQGMLNIQGTARPYAGQADVSGIMKLNQIPLVWTQPLLVDTGIRSIDGILAAEISFHLGAGQDASSGWQTKLDGTVSLQQFSGELPQARIGPTMLNWNGTLQMAGGGDSAAAGPRIRANGSLTADGADLLDRVYQKIKDRPEARLLLCGIAVPGDRQALRPTTAESQSAQANTKIQQHGGATPAIADARLLDLAEKRAESVRTYLVSLGIESGRLVFCAPEIGEEGTRPRVELAI
jgi:hypothetical protein